MSKTRIPTFTTALIFGLNLLSAQASDFVYEKLSYETQQHFIREIVNGNPVIISLDHPLTEEGRTDVEGSFEAPLIDQCCRACMEGNREFLYLEHTKGGDSKQIVKQAVAACVDARTFFPLKNPDLDFLIINNKEINEENFMLLQDLAEGRTFFPTLAMNLEIHERLARLSSQKHPLAQWYLAKILKHFSIRKDDYLQEASQHLLGAAKSAFRESVETKSLSCSLKGLYHEYLGENEKALSFFEEGVGKGEALSYYKIAQAREYEGEEDALDYYERAFILGYEKALYDVARHGRDENSVFLYLKKAGERGSAEAYSLIAKMIHDGFNPITHPSEEPWNRQEFWLYKGVNLKSVSAVLSLGGLYERQSEHAEAMGIYKQLASWGNIRGFLEQGKILENQREYQQCHQIYRNSNVGWFGLYALAEIASNREENKHYKKEASELFHSHFKKIIQIATQDS